MQFQDASLGTALHKARPTCKASAAPPGDSKLNVVSFDFQPLSLCFPVFSFGQLNLCCIQDALTPEESGPHEFLEAKQEQGTDDIWEYDLPDDTPADAQIIEEGSTEEDMMSPADSLDINDDDLATDLYQNFTDGDPYAVNFTAETADEATDVAAKNLSDSSSDGEVDECKIKNKIRRLEWKLEKNRKRRRI